MKTSYKMRKTIERLVKKYNFREDEISYHIEAIESNRHGNDYYDYASLYSASPVRLSFIVAFDGSSYKC